MPSDRGVWNSVPAMVVFFLQLAHPGPRRDGSTAGLAQQKQQAAGFRAGLGVQNGATLLAAYQGAEAARLPESEASPRDRLTLATIWAESPATMRFERPGGL